MPRLMYDSDEEDALRRHVPDADLVALYADLVTTDSVRYWGDRLVVIDRGMGDPLGLATVIDVEKGADRIAQSPQIYDRWHAEGREYITAYVNRANMAAVDAAMGSRNFWHWIATLDGTVRVPEHPHAAVQALGEQAIGFHADESHIWNGAWRPASWPRRALFHVNAAAQLLQHKQ